MRILMISSEATPIAKSGGLADVLTSLSSELIAGGDDLLLILPRYSWISLSKSKDAQNPDISSHPDLSPLKKEASFHLKLGMDSVTHTPYRGMLRNIPIVLLDSELFAGYEKLYGDELGDYSHNARRFANFSAAALSYVERENWKPDAVHVHDWQTALAPYYLEKSKFFKGTRSLLTIHNLGYQGIFSNYDVVHTGLSPEDLYLHGQLNFLAAGLKKADAISTVSPSYAKEICTPKQGFGLDSLLCSRKKDLVGILNGIDYQEWDPQKDSHLEHHYSHKNLSGKAELKALIQKRYGLPVRPDVPLFVSISRLAVQKGFDQLLEEKTFASLMKQDIQYIILGTGQKNYEDAIRSYAEQYENFVALVCFDMKLSHELEAAADFFVMPSIYEPCGLNQLFSLAYGAIPIVHKTGGLADTIAGLDQKAPTGIVIDSLSSEKLCSAFGQAVELYRDKESYQAIQKRGMKKRFDWKRAANLYRNLYTKRK